MKRIFAVLIIFTVAGCDVFGWACTDESRPAIRVFLVDSITGGPLPTEEFTVVARDGAYADSARFTAAQPNVLAQVGLAYERPGRYRVEVRASGYAPWVREGIRVTEDLCSHVRVVDVVARLQL